MSVSNPTLAHDQLIQRSWARCREAGLEHHHVPRFEPLARVALQQMLDGHQALLHTTHREVLPYYEHILGNSRCLIRLADPQARLLRSWGAQPGAGAGHLGHAPGACWLEAAAGTNPIGTALACRQAVHVEPDEHFLLANRLMNGSASPIFDAQRQMVAVLDVSSDSHLPPSHTLGLVKMMSQTVENRLILEAFADRHHQLIFNTGVNNLDSQWAGLLVFDDSGRVLAANRRADSLLGAELPGLTLQQLFRLTPRLCSTIRRSAPLPCNRQDAAACNACSRSPPCVLRRPPRDVVPTRAWTRPCNKGCACWRRTCPCCCAATLAPARRCWSRPCTKPAAARRAH